MIADDRWSPFEAAVAMITSPVWVPIYLIGVGLGKLGKAWLKRKPEPPPPAEARLIWTPVTDLERQVYAAMILAGRPVTNAELAHLMNVSPGQASKMVGQLEGRIQKIRDGRRVQISLPHYH